MRAICTNPEGKIHPGSFARIHLALDRISNAVMVPSQAIIPVMNGQRIYIFRHGKAMQFEVKTGIRNDREIQILKGVNNGDTIITSGFMQIRPGDNVRIMSYMNQ
jgi:membrane fusion protein (multidrug efflux system)